MIYLLKPSLFKQYRYAYYFSFYWKVHMKFLNLLYVCNYSKYFRTIVKSTYLLFSSHEVLNDQFIQERINCIKNPQLSIETGRWNEILINDRNNIELTLPIANEFYFVHIHICMERSFFVFCFMDQMWKVTLKFTNCLFHEACNSFAFTNEKVLYFFVFKKFLHVCTMLDLRVTAYVEYVP